MKSKDRTPPGPSAGGARPTLADLESAIQRLEQSRQRTARVLARLTAEQRRFDERLIAIEHGPFFRLMRGIGGPLLRWISAAGGGPDPDAVYRRWLAGQSEHAGSVEQFDYQPVISLLLSVEGARREDADWTLASIRSQTYGFWRLHIVTGLDNEPHSKRLPDSIHEDTRIVVDNITFEQAVDAVRESGDGDYVMLMRAGDMLSPSALFEMVRSMQDGDADAVYTDEDSIGPDGQLCSPVFKPDWSPDLLARGMYLGGAFAISRRALARIGFLSNEYGPQREFDAALRLAETGASFRHVPQVLFHRGSTPSPEEHEAGRRALAAAVRRRQWQADIGDGPLPLTYRLARRPEGTPLVSIVVCSRTPKLVRALLNKLESRTAYANYEIILVEHGVRFPENVVRSRRNVTRVPYEGAFNFSRMNNRAVQSARGEILLFLNDDIEPLDPAWLGCLVAEVQRPEVGAAGAKLLYPSGAIQHAGVALGILDGAGHPGRGQSNPPYWKWVGMTRNVSAVTGACMAVRRAVFDQARGFDEAFPSNYNDIDFCLRVRDSGYEVVYDAEAILRHYEAQSRKAVVRYAERERFFKRWQNVLEAGDPYYNRNLTRDRDDVSLRAGDEE